MYLARITFRLCKLLSSSCSRTATGKPSLARLEEETLPAARLCTLLDSIVVCALAKLSCLVLLPNLPSSSPHTPLLPASPCKCEIYLYRSDLLMSHGSWAAGAFDTTYVLTVTPNADGTDQPLWIDAVKPNLP